MQPRRSRLHWRVRLDRLVMPLALVALISGGCTSETAEPTPTPTPSSTSPAQQPSVRVGIVVGTPAGVARDEARPGIESLSQSLPSGSALRVIDADEGFAADIGQLLVDEEYDLVCFVDVPSAEVARIAVGAPAARFCSVPAQAASLPDNVLAIDLRVEEAAYVVGAAARAVVPGTDLALLARPSTFAVDRLEAGLALAVDATEESPTGPRVLVRGDIEDEEQAITAVNEVLDLGAVVVMSRLGELDAASLDVVASRLVGPPAPSESPSEVVTEEPTTEPSQDESPPPIIAGGPSLRGASSEPTASPSPSATSPDGQLAPADHVLAIIRHHVEVGLAVAVSRLLGDWGTDTVTVGLAQEALSIEPGGGWIGGEAAGAIEQATAAILDGSALVELTG